MAAAVFPPGDVMETTHDGPLAVVWPAMTRLAALCFFAWGLAATGSLADWFILAGDQPPIAWRMLKTGGLSFWGALALVVFFMIDRWLEGRQRLPGEAPFRIWSSAEFLTGVSVIASLHSFLWITEGYLAGWHGWPLWLIALPWVFPVCGMLAVVVGFAARFSNGRLLRVAHFVIPGLCIALQAAIILSGKTVYARIVRGMGLWLGNTAGAALALGVAGIIVLLWLIERRLWKTTRRTQEFAFVGLWLVAAATHATVASSLEAVTASVPTGYQIAACTILSGVWVLAVCIRVIEHLRARREMRQA